MTARCKICFTENQALIDVVNTMLLDDELPKNIVNRIQEDFGEAFSVANVNTHRKHLSASEDVKYPPFYLKDDILYLVETNEPVEFIDAKVALKIILTIGALNILKTGGNRLSARYVVEAAKILSELGQDDTVSAMITEAWHNRLKEKPAHVTVIENPVDQAVNYRELQEAKREAFQIRIDKPASRND